MHRDQFTSINDVNEFPSSAGNPLNKRDGNTYIYLKESLTKLNSLLLKKENGKLKSYTYTGYTYKGEVRVKKSDAATFISIHSSVRGH